MTNQLLIPNCFSSFSSELQPLFRLIEEGKRCFFPGKLLDLANLVLKNVRERKISSALWNMTTFLANGLQKAGFFLRYCLPPSSEQVAPISKVEGLNESGSSSSGVLVDSDVHGDPCFCSKVRPIEKKHLYLSRDRRPCKVVFANSVAPLTHSQIEAHFSSFGDLVATYVHSDPSRVPSGMAEVVFKRRLDAIEAMNHSKDNPIHGKQRNVWEDEGFSPSISSANGKLVLSNLDPGITFSHLNKLFAKFGDLVAVALHRDLAGKALGTAHVIFESWYCALRAMRQFNGASVDGQLLQIEITTSEPNPHSVTSGKLIIANLDSTTSHSDISKLFSQIGNICGAAVHYSLSRSFSTAEVYFVDHSDAIKAKQLYNGFLVKGRPMQVQLATSASESAYSDPNKLLMKELSCCDTYSLLLQIFSQFGKLRALSLINCYHRYCKAEVVFEERSAAIKAMKHCIEVGHQICGWPLRLQVELAPSVAHQKPSIKPRKSDRVTRSMAASGRVSKPYRRRVQGAKQIRGSRGWTCGGKRVVKRRALTSIDLDAYLKSR